MRKSRKYMKERVKYRNLLLAGFIKAQGETGMHFKLSEEHEMIRKMVRDFAKNEVAPTAAERDEEERFDRALFDQMAEPWFNRIPWPEEYGGIGSDYLAYVIAIEELSRVCASTGVTLSAHTSLAGWPILNLEQKNKSKHFTTDG